jgi:hypothetical protein
MERQHTTITTRAMKNITFYFFVVLRPNAGHGFLILEVFF